MARNYEIHQLTTRLVRDYDVIAIEDLNVKGMSRGFLSRSMLDAAFGEFTRQLAYKAAWYGKQLVKIDRRRAKESTGGAVRAMSPR